MQLIYIHGLDSSCHAAKGMALQQHCQIHHPDIKVLRPDLNKKPQQVLDNLLALIAKDKKTLLVGSSLGGFFATLCSNQTGVRTVLLNPSTQPYESLKRFGNSPNPDKVIYTTTGGWQITIADLQWFKRMKQTIPTHPNQLMVLLKTGDEVLDYHLAQDYYSQSQAQCHVVVETGGDHGISDFKEKIPMVMQFLLTEQPL